MPKPDPRLDEFKADNLSQACIFSHGINIDFSVVHMNYTFVMPEITNDILEQYYAGYLDNMPRDLDGFESLDEYATQFVDEFEQSDSFHDWQMDFEPHTSWFYHVPLTDKSVSELQAIATNIFDWTGNVTLLECKGEYYLTFNASGMNLNWDMSAAFIACGFIPPFGTLENLPAYASDGKYKSNLENTVSSLVLSSVLGCAIVLAHRADSLTASLETLTNTKGQKHVG